jgi:hypothetical protein
MAKASAADDSSLKRLGGGRWQTRDERFMIEPQSGTWVVVDAEQTDDLGLPLVRGPFRSLGDAKDAITTARSSPPAASPLAGRISRPRATSDARPAEKSSRVKPEAAEKAGHEPKARPEPPDEAPAEPRWIADLDPEARRHARRLIARLESAGAPDPEGMARRDVAGDVAAVAAYAVERQLAGLGAKADPKEVAALLADGRDDGLGVRWRIVDGDGRPIRVGSGKGGSARGRGR